MRVAGWGWGSPTRAALPTILPGLGTVSSQRCLAEQRRETEGSDLGRPTLGPPLASNGLRAWVRGLLMPAWPPKLGPPGQSRGQFPGWSPSLGSTWSSEGSYQAPSSWGPIPVRLCTDLCSPPPHPRRAQASDTSDPACLGLSAWRAEFTPGVASTAPETRGIEEVKQERKHYLGTLTLAPELGKPAGQGPSAESAHGLGQGSGCRCGGPCGEAGGAGVGAVGRQRRAGRPAAAPLARPGGDLAPLLQALNRPLAPSWRH